MTSMHQSAISAELAGSPEAGARATSPSSSLVQRLRALVRRTPAELNPAEPSPQADQLPAASLDPRRALQASGADVARPRTAAPSDRGSGSGSGPPPHTRAAGMGFGPGVGACAPAPATEGRLPPAPVVAVADAGVCIGPGGPGPGPSKAGLGAEGLLPGPSGSGPEAGEPGAGGPRQAPAGAGPGAERPLVEGPGAGPPGSGGDDPRVATWAPPASPWGLVEECLFADPWRLLVACILLNRTTGGQVRRVLGPLWAAFPTPQALALADPRRLSAILRPLGLHNSRAARLRRFSEEYVRKQWTHPSQLHGVGPYAADAYAIFCRRDGWRGVQPSDKDLRRYRDWLEATGGQGSGLEREDVGALLAAGLEAARGEGEDGEGSEEGEGKGRSRGGRGGGGGGGGRRGRAGENLGASLAAGLEAAEEETKEDGVKGKGKGRRGGHGRHRRQEPPPRVEPGGLDGVGTGGWDLQGGEGAGEEEGSAAAADAGTGQQRRARRGEATVASEGAGRTRGVEEKPWGRGRR
ncbi:hypothetical protein HYH03_013882 [Edaphochlamys debaryana]|uniref:Methyl-CpG-binding domain protein 4 n=1 Tax=Edaphochlamys debaryana TaxID=47281 RepID=A0A835XXD0_9CHLO|nr:hypothetical protein HYH03_013882 [Edaphochlamys debaryana]|eukprot:KAG2487459.1 hypothetical protein HYH03_013882 [Edaphochlamys debaryana]